MDFVAPPTNPTPAPPSKDEEAPETTANPGPSSLARAVNDLYTQWRTNRQAAGLDAKWQANWDNFKSEAAGGWKNGEGDGKRSRTTIQVTKSRCTMAYAIVLDLVLQGGEVPFDLKLGKWQGVSVGELPPEVRKELEKRAEGLRDRIKGQLAMANADRSLSKTILSGAIYGEGYQKITHRRFEEYNWVAEAPDGFSLTDVQPNSAQVWSKQPSVTTGPAPNYAHVWDIFRDLETPDPRQGKGFIHRQPVSPNWLFTRKGKPYFDTAAIERVLAKHRGVTDPDTGTGEIAIDDGQTMSPRLRNITNRTKSLIVKEFWGLLPRRAVEVHEEEMGGKAREVPTVAELDQSEGDEVECHVMVCDDEVVRFVRTHRTDRPLYRFVWEEGLEEDEATGVADNVADLQFVTNGAFRAIEDNIRQTANTIWAMYEPYIKNSAEIKKNGMQPGTVVWLKDARNIQEAIQQMPTNDVTAPLVGLVQLCLQMLDNDSLIPRTQMGVGDSNRSTTAYEVSTQIASSTKYLGAVVRRIDETLIEPIGSYFYDYAMRDPSNPYKGNFVVQATGFQSYHDRLLVFDQISRMLQIFMSNPVMAVHANVRGCMELIAKALDQDPDFVLRSDEEAMQMMQAMQTDPMKLAQQNLADAKARKEQAGAMKLMNDIKVQSNDSKVKTAQAASQIRTEAQMAMRPTSGGGK